VAGSDGTPARVELGEKFGQPAGTGTWADAGSEASSEALKVLEEQGVDAWRAFVRRTTTQKVMDRAAVVLPALPEDPDERMYFDRHERAAHLAGRARGNSGALRDYWTKGAGLAKWRGSPTPWRTLRGFLSKYLSGEELDATTSSWYRIVFGALPMDR